VQKDDIVVDATLGGGGHAVELVKGLGGNGLFIGFDADADAIPRTQKVLEGCHIPIHLINANFRHLAGELHKLNIRRITKVLFDLGWSSYQLDSGRGFSFLKDEPLRMTYAKEDSALTAEVVVNTWSESSLADVIYGFGEERYARRIAKAIVTHRVKTPFKTSRELAEVIYATVPPVYRKGRLHPATRTFQALRIAVNDELGALSEGLRAARELLEDGGRIAVISFHSIEDRIVKQTFVKWEKEGSGHRVTKKPITPTPEEIDRNPHARSAKLRVIEKISYESPHTKNKQIRPFDIPGEA
jgi:16S rRNA (cytosine1402-N4)-methyltransferase